jgi:2',3'-cyclic-nucleotide 2'-phosphodiesterase (5'-nucleotidase family)
MADWIARRMALEAIRTNSTNLLYVDGGNLFVPEGATDIKKFADQAPVIVEALNVMSLDVFAPGPSDFAFR